MDRFEKAAALNFFRKKCTTLVEQARHEGREEAVDYIAEHSECNPVTEDDRQVGEMYFVPDEILNAARTISSDKK